MVAAPYFQSPICANNHLYILHQISVPLIQPIFTSLFHPYLFTNLYLQSPLTIPSFIPHKFWLFWFCVLPFQHSTLKMFSHLSYLANSGSVKGTKEQGRLLRTDNVLISPFFLKVWIVITGLTITDSLFAQAQKIDVLQVVVSNEDDACNRNDKPFNPPSLIPSTYCHYFHTLLIPSEKLTFLWKPVDWLEFHLKLTILM